MDIIKNCPFCKGKGELYKIIKKIIPGEYYNEDEFYFVKCLDCESQSKPVKVEPLHIYFNELVEDCRNNFVLRAKKEEKYDQYIEIQKQKAISFWNKRNHKES